MPGTGVPGTHACVVGRRAPPSPVAGFTRPLGAPEPRVHRLIFPSVAAGPIASRLEEEAARAARVGRARANDDDRLEGMGGGVRGILTAREPDGLGRLRIPGSRSPGYPAYVTGLARSPFPGNAFPGKVEEWDQGIPFRLGAGRAFMPGLRLEQEELCSSCDYWRRRLQAPTIIEGGPCHAMWQGPTLSL